MFHRYSPVNPRSRSPRRRFLSVEQLEDRALFTINFDNVEQLATSVNSLQATANSQVFQVALPLIGNQFKDSAPGTFLSTFGGELATKLGSVTTEGGMETALAAAATDVGGSLVGSVDRLSLKDGMGNDLTDPTHADAATAVYKATFSLDASDTINLTANLALAGLGLNLTSNVSADVAVDATYTIKFSVNSGGTVTMLHDLTDELVVDATVDINDVSGDELKGKLGLLKFSANNTTVGNELTMKYYVDVTSGGISATATLDANLDAKLTAEFGSSAINPKIESNFDFDWEVATKTAISSLPTAGTITTEFNDVKLNAGSFFGSFLKPLVDHIRDLTSPINDIADFLNKSPFDDLDVLPQMRELTYGKLLTVAHELAKPQADQLPETLLFTAALRTATSGGALAIPSTFNALVAKIEENGSPIRALEVIGKLGELETLAGNLGSSGAAINLGSFKLTDVRDAGAPGYAENNSLGNVTSRIRDISDPLADLLDEFRVKVDGSFNGGFEIEALKNTTNLFDLFLGKNADLFSFTAPNPHFVLQDTFAVLTFVGPVPIQYGIRGGIQIDTRLKVVYDSTGLAGGNPLEGFYLDNPWADAAHTRHVPFISITSPGDHLLEVFVQAGFEGSPFDIVEQFFGVEVPGEIKAFDFGSIDIGFEGNLFLDGSVNFSVNDTDEELRLSELLAIADDLGCAIRTDAELTFGGEVDFSFVTDLVPEIPATYVYNPFKGENVQVTPSFDPDVNYRAKILGPFTTTLLEFTSGVCDHRDGDGDEAPTVPPHLADKIEIDGVQTLVLNVGSRSGLRNAGAGVTSEEFLVEHVGGVYGDESLRVTAFGVSEIHHGIAAIYVNAGHNVAPEDDSDAIILDYGVLSDAEIQGGVGDDYLYGGDGINKIYGDEGNDLIWGGAEGDYLYGNADDDTLIGFGGSDELYGGSGKDTLIGDDEEGELAFNDFLYGGSEDDKLYGKGGNDKLYGEAGHDDLFGGDGDDTLEGSTGNDDFFGGAGHDTIQETGNADFVLTTRTLDGLGHDTLSGIQDAYLYGTSGEESFTVLRWTGVAFLVGMSGDDVYDVTIVGAGSGTVFAADLDGGELTAHGTNKSDVFVLDYEDDSTFGLGRIAEGNERIYYTNTIDDVTVKGAAARDYIYVEETIASVSLLVDGEAGDDYIKVSKNGSLDSILGNVTVNGTFVDAPVDAVLDTTYVFQGDELLVDDSASTGSYSYTVQSDKLLRHGIGTIYYADLDLLTLNANEMANAITVDGPTAFKNFIKAKGGNDTILVVSTAERVITTVQGGTGDDLINVTSTQLGNFGNLDAIRGQLAIVGGQNADRIYINDRGNSARANYRITPTSVSDLASATLSTNEFRYQTPPRTSFAGIAYDATTERLQLDGTDQANVFDVSPSFYTHIFIDGNLPAPGSVAPDLGDYLKLDTKTLGANDRTLEITSRGSGRWYFPDTKLAGVLPEVKLKDVQFESIEKFNHVDIVAVGADVSSIGASKPRVLVYDAETMKLKTKMDLSPAKTYGAANKYGIRVAVADMDGDGLPDVIVAPGRNTAPDIKIFSGRPQVGVEGTLLQTIAAVNTYGARFVDGVFLAAGDVDNDLMPDLVLAPGRGKANIKVYQNQAIPDPGANAPTKLPLVTTPRTFDAFPDLPNFIGGATVAIGDLNGNANGKTFGHIVVATGSGVAGRIRAFNASLPTIPTYTTIIDPSGFMQGLNVATGDVDGDGKFEIITGNGSGGNSWVRVYDVHATTKVGTNTLSFRAFPLAAEIPHATLRVTLRDIDGDGKAEIFAAQGQDGRSGYKVKRFNGSTGAAIDAVFATSPDFFGGGLNLG